MLSEQGYGSEALPSERTRLAILSHTVFGHMSEQLKCEIVELNVQIDHVYLISMVPPKISISDYLGTIKGRTAIRILNTYRHLREKPYWGNHFWSRGYCVDTVGLDSEMIRKYVKYQEAKERREEQVQKKLF